MAPPARGVNSSLKDTLPPTLVWTEAAAGEMEESRLGNHQARKDSSSLLGPKAPCRLGFRTTPEMWLLSVSFVFLESQLRDQSPLLCLRLYRVCIQGLLGIRPGGSGGGTRWSPLLADPASKHL